MSAPIYTYSATELAELVRLRDMERAARAAWNAAATRLDAALCADRVAYEAWLIAMRAADNYGVTLSTINPE